MFPPAPGLLLMSRVMFNMLCRLIMPSSFTSSLFLAMIRLLALVLTSARAVGLPTSIGLARCVLLTPSCFSKKYWASWILLLAGRLFLNPIPFSKDVLPSAPSGPLLFVTVILLLFVSFVAIAVFVLIPSVVGPCQQWRRNLLTRAASGDWAARRMLCRKSAASMLSRAKPLVDKCGSPQQAAAHVQDHFAARFENLGASAFVSFQELPDTEPPFSEQEVLQAVSQLKLGKTTGMSKVSVELLRGLVSVSFGLYVLTLMLNTLLHCPTSSNLALGFGWVILLPKSAWIDHASGFRPIVCGEVLAKLAARLATLRVTNLWPVPDCCFGCVRGSGLCEALYIVKHVAQECAGLNDSCSA